MMNLHFIAVADQIYSFILSPIMLHVAPVTLFSFLMILGEELKLWPFSLRISSTLLPLSLSAHTISQGNEAMFVIFIYKRVNWNYFCNLGTKPKLLLTENPTVLKCHFSFVALRPHSGSWPPLTGLRDLTHWTHIHTHTQTQYDSSGRVISPTQRTLPGNTQHSQDTCSLLDWNCKPSKRAVADPRLRPARLLESENVIYNTIIYTHFQHYFLFILISVTLYT
jgi:hypothetical protein